MVDKMSSPVREGTSNYLAEPLSPRGKGLQLVSTLPLRQLLEKAAHNEDLSQELRDEADALMREDKLSWRRIKPIYTASLKARNEDSPHLKEICKGSSIVREPPPQPTKSPELLARLEKLQRAEEERQYKRMVHDVTGQERKAEALRVGGLVTYKDQMSYGAHVIVVMGVFYLMGHFAASRVSSQTGMKAAGGLVGLVIAMLMETILLIIRTSDYGSKKKVGSGQKPPRRNSPLTPNPTDTQSVPTEPKKQR